MSGCLPHTTGKSLSSNNHVLTSSVVQIGLCRHWWSPHWLGNCLLMTQQMSAIHQINMHIRPPIAGGYTMESPQQKHCGEKSVLCVLPQHIPKP